MFDEASFVYIVMRR